MTAKFGKKFVREINQVLFPQKLTYLNGGVLGDFEIKELKYTIDVILFDTVNMGSARVLAGFDSVES